MAFCNAVSTTGSAIRPRVLVVDDNRDCARMMAALVDLMGAEVRIAHTGRDALEIGGPFAPDCVILDISMPSLDGYDTCRRLRSHDWGSAAMVVALTGWGRPCDKDKAHAAGFDAHWVKPVDIHQVRDLMNSLGSVQQKNDGRRSVHMC
jgi:CheY-like chemotaxis protein